MNDRTYRRELSDRFVSIGEQMERQMLLQVLAEWKDTDLTIPQVQTLLLLEIMGPSRMGTISAFLGRALSGATIVVDRLVGWELVSRSTSDSDRRVVLCSLTSSGEAMVAQLLQIGRKRAHRMLDAMTEEQLELALRGLELLRQVDEQVNEVGVPLPVPAQRPS